MCWIQSGTRQRPLTLIHVYALPRIPDKRWWFCFYWVMGAYVMCENGLHRSDADVAAGLLYAVFPSLHKVSDGYVTTQIGNAIKVNLPKKVQENDQWKKWFSAKCIRIGGINTISLHALITLFQACARTGHATGTCIDSYLDPMNPLKGLPGAHAFMETRSST